MKFLTDINSRVAQFQRNRRAIQQLRACTDRELSDIGISRSMISSAVRTGLSQR